MKITARTTESFLEKPQAQCRAALVYGPDQGLARERVRRIRDAVLGKDFDPFAYAELEEKLLLEDPARLADEILAIHMMAPRRVICASGGDKITRIVEAALPHLHDHAFLIVRADELGPRSSLRSLFEGESSLAALPCYHDEIRDIQAVIRKKFSESGIETENGVIDYLVSQLGNDRYVTYQELEKIILYAGHEKKISMHDAILLVGENRETTGDDIVQAVADRSLALLEEHIQAQLRAGDNPIAYLRSLQRYFNRLYFIRAQMALGRGLDEVIAGLKPKVFFKQEQSLRRHAQSWELSQIAKALGLFLNAELACKTSDLPPVPASSRRLFQATQLR